MNTKEREKLERMAEEALAEIGINIDEVAVSVRQRFNESLDLTIKLWAVLQKEKPHPFACKFAMLILADDFNERFGAAFTVMEGFLVEAYKMCKAEANGVEYEPNVPPFN